MFQCFNSGTFVTFILPSSTTLSMDTDFFCWISALGFEIIWIKLLSAYLTVL